MSTAPPIIRLADLGPDERELYLDFLVQKNVSFAIDEEDGSYVATILIEPGPAAEAATVADVTPGSTSPPSPLAPSLPVQPSSRSSTLTWTPPSAAAAAASSSDQGLRRSSSVPSSVRGTPASLAMPFVSKYAKLCAMLSDVPAQSVRVRPMPWLTKLMDTIYDEFLRKETADPQWRFSMDMSARLDRIVPVFVVRLLSKMHGLRHIVDQICWDLLATVEHFASEYPDVELFSEFLSEALQHDDLAFYVRAASVVDRMLGSRRPAVDRQPRPMRWAQCVSAAQKIFSQFLDSTAATSLPMFLTALETLMSGRRRPLDAAEFLRLAVLHQHARQAPPRLRSPSLSPTALLSSSPPPLPSADSADDAARDGAPATVLALQQRLAQLHDVQERTARTLAAHREATERYDQVYAGVRAALGTLVGTDDGLLDPRARLLARSIVAQHEAARAELLAQRGAADAPTTLSPASQASAAAAAAAGGGFTATAAAAAPAPTAAATLVSPSAARPVVGALPPAPATPSSVPLGPGASVVAAAAAAVAAQARPASPRTPPVAPLRAAAGPPPSPVPSLAVTLRDGGAPYEWAGSPRMRSAGAADASELERVAAYASLDGALPVAAGAALQWQVGAYVTRRLAAASSLSPVAQADVRALLRQQVEIVVMPEAVARRDELQALRGEALDAACRDLVESAAEQIEPLAARLIDEAIRVAASDPRSETS